MEEFNIGSELNAGETIYPTQADAFDVWNYLIASFAVGEYPLSENVPFSGRISKFTVRAKAGTGTFTIAIGGVNVPGLVDKAISTSEAFYIPSDLNTFHVDQDISISITAESGLTGIAISISVLRDTTIPFITDVTVETGTSPAFLEEISMVLPAGALLIDVPFSATKLNEMGIPTSQYRINAQPLVNVTDAVVDRVFYIVVGQTPTKITLLLSGNLTTSNTIFRAVIATAGGATDILMAGGTAEGGGSISATTLPLRGDNSGGAVAITQQSGDVATGLTSLNLFSATPTYDPAKLAGLIPQGKLGIGGLGAGTKVLYDDQTYKTPPVATGNVAADSIWDAKGDLVVATGNDVAIRQAVGANNRLWIADSAQATGIKWGLLTDVMVDPANVDGLTTVPSLRTLGFGSQQAMAGNDIRVSGALQASNNLEDVESVAQSRVTLELGSMALLTAPSGTVASNDNAITFTSKDISGITNNLHDIPASSIVGTNTMSLPDPNIDTLVFWDDSEAAWDWLTYQFETLTDGAVITWNLNPARMVSFGRVTLGGTQSLNPQGQQAGMRIELFITQDATGGRGIILPAGSKVQGGGGGAVTLTATAGATDKLIGVWDGAIWMFEVKLNYT